MPKLRKGEKRLFWILHKIMNGNLDFRLSFVRQCNIAYRSYSVVHVQLYFQIFFILYISFLQARQSATCN